MSDELVDADAEQIRNWEELDAQRDVAFKVMYFFIVFIIGTFGLLFAYFQMSKQEEEEQREKNGQPKQKATDHTFFDFLAGQMEDQEIYNVNPYARSTQSKSSVNEDGSVSVSINAHRDNSGFGSKNLESLASPYE